MKKILAVVLLLLTTFLLIGCLTSEKPSPTISPSPSPLIVSQQPTVSEQPGEEPPPVPEESGLPAVAS